MYLLGFVRWSDNMIKERIMDPNKTLAALREAVRDWERANTLEDAAYAASQVIEHFQNLDEWLSKGGFLPAAWRGALPASITHMPAEPTRGA